MTAFRCEMRNTSERARYEKGFIHSRGLSVKRLLERTDAAADGTFLQSETGLLRYTTQSICCEVSVLHFMLGASGMHAAHSIQHT